LESLFPDLFLGLEEGVVRRIIGVYAYAQKVIPVSRAAVFPGAGDANRVLGNASEALA
jgi:hypothetical protein